ncbi:MAG: monovalent cation:proton antiporter-2 (CPA2) family protein [Betaproteobacteria bacterium]|nr:monovalent cation:proton antiporter-2 (CPA2) family protein [Betaproteobacteria bacterium]
MTLTAVLILLAASVAAVLVCRTIQMPAILGYLLVGVALGPNGFALISDSEDARHLAEFGIVFLMFTLGLEFSLPQLKAMRRAVLGLGAAQVGVCAVIGLVILVALGYSWGAGLVIGGMFAMSSTAIVLKMLIERDEVSSEYGRNAIAILLFQDLAVIGFLVLIPALGQSGWGLALALVLAVIKAAVAFVLILKLGQKPMRIWLNTIARQRSPELFMLNVLLIVLALATLTSLVGLSMALGAFMAGMLIAETEHRHIVEDNILSFRDLLLGLFFVTMGMAINPGLVVRNIEVVLLFLLVSFFVKGLVVVGLARFFGGTWSSNVRIGIYLAQTGELALVMLTLANDYSILPPYLKQTILMAISLSMLTAPVIIRISEPFIRWFERFDWQESAARIMKVATQSMVYQDHVIICGYGRSGQNLARLLEAEKIGFVALDSDPLRVRESAEGVAVIYGDASNRDILAAAGLNKARALVITFANTPQALKIINVVHATRPTLPIIVRTYDDSNLDRLLEAGATEVVPEIIEGSLMLASHSLLALGIPLPRVLARIRSVREERYSLLRGFFHGVSDAQEDAEENLQPRLRSVVLMDGAAAIGKTLGELDLEELVKVSRVRRVGKAPKVPDENWRFEVGDTVVLLGRADDLSFAVQRLQEGELKV